MRRSLQRGVRLSLLISFSLQEDERSPSPVAEVEELGALLVNALCQDAVLRQLADALGPFLAPPTPAKRGPGRPKLISSASVASDTASSSTPAAASPAEHPSKPAARAALVDLMKTVTVCDRLHGLA